MAKRATTATAPAAEGQPSDTFGVNEVLLTGRLGTAPEVRELPSGDTVVQLRLVVPRPPPAPKAPKGRPSTDTIDVACWSAPLRRKAVRLGHGDVVTVRGSLRRRFWRSPAGLGSRYEIEAADLQRDRRASRAAVAETMGP